MYKQKGGSGKQHDLNHVSVHYMYPGVARFRYKITSMDVHRLSQFPIHKTNETWNKKTNGMCWISAVFDIEYVRDKRAHLSCGLIRFGCTEVLIQVLLIHNFQGRSLNGHWSTGVLDRILLDHWL